MAHALIDTRPLGRSGLEVPRIMLGCGNFGGVGSAPEFFGQGIDDDGALALMDAAWDMGLRHFDTADAYGGGHSEAMIGRWCATRGVRPAITTKTFNPMNTGADHGLAPERIDRQLAASLERLDRDHVEPSAPSRPRARRGRSAPTA
jgi:aryl-alcohol dehydrogenase-like predicted oxidoreductase